MSEIKATYIDHAYAAGFLEADGCIHMTDNSVCVRITNRNLAVLAWFAERYKGQVRSKIIPAGCWEWNVHSKDAIDFINSVYPHLIFKKPQADLLYQFMKTKQKRGVRLPEAVVQVRKYFHNQMKKEKAKWRS